MELRGAYTQLSDDAYMAFIPGKSFPRLREQNMNPIQDRLREDRTKSFNEAAKYLQTLTNKTTDYLGDTYILVDAAFLFHEEFLKENVVMRIRQHDTYFVFSIRKSAVAEENDHAPIYNTLFHLFEVQEDGALRIMSREGFSNPFMVWIREAPTIKPEDV